MDQTLRLRNHPTVIGPATDFTYKWGLNAGLTEPRARRLALAVDELVTDVVRFAFPDEDALFDLIFRHDLTTTEVIIRERGEPFDPSRYPYDAEAAREEGIFDGAGFAIVRHMADDFAFLNKGRQGKEFRLVQYIEAEHIAEIDPSVPFDAPPDEANEPEYTLTMATPDDAEDIAKLIYRTYGYSYAKEDMYYPEKIARGLREGEKFAVIVRTQHGRAVANFSVIRSTDSRIGEVGEAVVDVNHRRRGLMKRMLRRLMDEAADRSLLGAFGEAVTVHDISQRVNAHFGMESTAVILAFHNIGRFKGLVDDYPQPISIVLEFRPLVPYGTVTAYLPRCYADLLHRIYNALGATVDTPGPEEEPIHGRLPEEAVIDTRINYAFGHVELVVEKAGADVAEQARQTIEDVSDDEMYVVMIDLPMDDPHTPAMTDLLRDEGFVFAGLMPRFHNERDYLRLQHPLVQLDLDRIELYSDLSYTIMNQIAEELPWTSNEMVTS